MEWNTFIENYKAQESFDKQLEFLKLYHSNFVLWEFIKQHFYEFWKNTKFEMSVDYCSLLYMLTGNPTMHKVLQKYLYLILLDTWDYQLDRVMKLLIDSGVVISIDDSFEEFLNDYLLSHEYEDNCKLIKVLDLKDKTEKYTRFLIQEQLNNIVQFQDKENSSKDIYNQMIELLILDLKRIAKKDEVEDTVYYIGGGSLAKVFKIGKYVLKIGEKRFYPMNENMNSPYLIQRLFYKAFVDHNLCIEIMPFVNVKNVTKNDVQKMYNKNREDGYFWCDPKVENMGVLLWDTENLFPELTSLGRAFLGVFPFQVQQVGQKVIIDLDCYFDFRNLSSEKQEQKIQKHYYGWNDLYEQRYQQQKKRILDKRKI